MADGTCPSPVPDRIRGKALYSDVIDPDYFDASIYAPIAAGRRVCGRPLPRSPTILAGSNQRHPAWAALRALRMDSASEILRIVQSKERKGNTMSRTSNSLVRRVEALERTAAR